jgi:hypothetical protein
MRAQQPLDAVATDHPAPDGIAQGNLHVIEGHRFVPRLRQARTTATQELGFSPSLGPEQAAPQSPRDAMHVATTPTSASLSTASPAHPPSTSWQQHLQEARVSPASHEYKHVPHPSGQKEGLADSTSLLAHQQDTLHTYVCSGPLPPQSTCDRPGGLPHMHATRVQQRPNTSARMHAHARAQQHPTCTAHDRACIIARMHEHPPEQVARAADEDSQRSSQAAHCVLGGRSDKQSSTFSSPSILHSPWSPGVCEFAGAGYGIEKAQSVPFLGFNQQMVGLLMPTGRAFPNGLPGWSIPREYGVQYIPGPHHRGPPYPAQAGHAPCRAGPGNPRRISGQGPQKSQKFGDTLGMNPQRNGYTRRRSPRRRCRVDNFRDSLDFLPQDLQSDEAQQSAVDDSDWWLPVVGELDRDAQELAHLSTGERSLQAVVVKDAFLTACSDVMVCLTLNVMVHLTLHKLQNWVWSTGR